MNNSANLGQIFKSVIKVTNLEGDQFGVAKLDVSKLEVSQLEVSQWEGDQLGVAKLEGGQSGVAKTARARCLEAKQMCLLIKDPRIPKIRVFFLTLHIILNL